MSFDPVAVLPHTRANFAEVWARHFGVQDEIAYARSPGASLSFLGRSDRLVLERVRHLDAFLRVHGRQGRHHWIHTLFIDPKRNWRDLLIEMERHIQDHDTFLLSQLDRLTPLFPEGADRKRAERIVGALRKRLSSVTEDRRSFESLAYSAGGSRKAATQLEGLRTMLGNPIVLGPSEPVMPRRLRTDKVGENLAARLYNSWVGLATFCRTHEEIALTSGANRLARGVRFFTRAIR